MARFLNRHVMELAGLRSFKNLNRTGVILSSSEAVVMQSIAEVTSWMDWWMFSMKSLALQSSSDIHLSAFSAWLVPDGSSQ